MTENEKAEKEQFIPVMASHYEKATTAAEWYRTQARTAANKEPRLIKASLDEVIKKFRLARKEISGPRRTKLKEDDFDDQKSDATAITARRHAPSPHSPKLRPAIAR